MPQESSTVHFMAALETLLTQRWPGGVKIPQFVRGYESRVIGSDSDFANVIGIDPVNENIGPWSSGAAVADVPYHTEVLAVLTYYTTQGEEVFEKTMNAILRILGRHRAVAGFYDIGAESGRPEMVPNRWMMKWNVKGKRVV